MLEKKIALLTSVTFNNIGNGFIDLGAEAALMKALPLNAELFKVSSNANFAATMGQGVVWYTGQFYAMTSLSI
jgi:hypothetical protein